MSDDTRKKILCLDFDGVIHSYESGWKGAGVVADGPVPGAIEFLKEATGAFEVHIYSSRSGQDDGIEAMQTWLARVVGEHYGMLPFWLDLIRWPTAKPPALVTIDDRVICFDGTWPHMDEIHNFKPWNRRGPA